MANLTYSGRLRQCLSTMPIGKPQNFFGLGIEKLQNGLYKLQGRQQLLTLDEASYAIYCKKMGDEPRLEQEIPDFPIYPDWLRAMTTHFPMTWAMAHGYKSEEYRSRTLAYRGVFLLHAGKSTASDAAIREWRIPQRDIHRGAILGAAKIVDSYMEEGTAIHVLEEAIVFPQPICGVNGQLQQLWKPKDASTIKSFNKAYMALKDLEYPLDLDSHT